MGKMTQQDGDHTSGKFIPSEAAMDQFYASRRRYIRPVLVFFPVLFLALVIPWKISALVLLGVGLIVVLIMVAQNFMVARRADQRLKAEKREWKARQARP